MILKSCARCSLYTLYTIPCHRNSGHWLRVSAQVGFLSSMHVNSWTASVDRLGRLGPHCKESWLLWTHIFAHISARFQAGTVTESASAMPLSAQGLKTLWAAAETDTFQLLGHFEDEPVTFSWPFPVAGFHPFCTGALLWESLSPGGSRHLLPHTPDTGFPFLKMPGLSILV